MTILVSVNFLQSPFCEYLQLSLALAPLVMSGFFFGRRIASTLPQKSSSVSCRPARRWVR
jgi:hypothetical protein